MGVNQKLYVAVCAVNCTVDGRFVVRTASSHRSDSQIFIENRDFFAYPPAFDASVMGARRNVAITFGHNKNLAIANRSRVSCAQNTLRASIGLKLHRDLEI